MANNTYTVTVGSQAYSFHDQSTGISICRGEEKELSSRQFRLKKIQQALSGGHLILVPEKNTVSQYSEQSIEKMDKKLQAQFKKGMTIEKLMKAYSFEDLKHIAARHQIEVDADDTIESLLQALYEDFEESNEK